jgi:hypothetical protein
MAFRITSALLISLAALVGQAQTPAFDRDPWLQDYATMKQALERTYANLAWFGSPEGDVDLRALDRQTMAALQAATSDVEARAAILAFVRGFHDGHFSQLRTPPANGAPAQPDVWTMTRQDPNSGCPALSNKQSSPAEFSRPFESLPGYHQLADGVTSPFRAAIVNVGATTTSVGIVRIPEFEELHVSLCVELWPHDELWTMQGKLLRGPMRRAMEHRWYQTLADLLRTFRREGVGAVLIDIGNNSGGDDSGDIAARLFTATPMHSSPLWMVQDPGAAGAYFDEQLDALGQASTTDAKVKALIDESLAVFTTGKSHLSDQTCPMDWVWHERRAWSAQSCRRLVAAGSAGGPLDWIAPGVVKDADVASVLHWPTQVTTLWGAWTGSVYVLTDNRTYSSAEMFAAVMQNNHVARTIGLRTGGDGCGFMSTPTPLVLPHSQLRFRVPNCVRLRADGTDEVAGVTPDLPVPMADGAAKVLDVLVGDLKRGR